MGTVTTPGPPASDGLLTCRVKRWITSATTGAAEACSPDDDGTSGVKSRTSIASFSANTFSAVSISVYPSAWNSSIVSSQLLLAIPSAQTINLITASINACTSATVSVCADDIAARYWLMIPMFCASTPTTPAALNVARVGVVFEPV